MGCLKMKNFIKMSALSLFLVITTLSPSDRESSCMAAGTDEKSDVTPEISVPKTFTDQEITAMDAEKLKQLAEIGSADQKSPLASYCLGQKYRKDKDAANSIKSFREIIEKFPKHYLAPKACVEIAFIHKENKDAKSEADILNRLSEDYPLYTENITGLYRLAEIYRDQKKLDDMRKTLDTLEARFADNREIIPGLFFSANEYLRNYNSKKAIEKFDKLLNVKDITTSQKAQALLGKAAAYEYDAQGPEAVKIYDEIAKMQVDATVIELAKKSRENISKAPKVPLVKFEELKAGTAEVTAKKAEDKPTGRISEGNDKTAEVRIK